MRHIIRKMKNNKDYDGGKKNHMDKIIILSFDKIHKKKK